MAPIKLASTADLKPNQMKAVNANGTPILLVNLNGSFYAIGNKCTHRGCALSNGTLNGDTLKCACHGSVFNVKTGEVIGGPAKKPEPKYELQVSGDQILVNL
jgi:nitrite reductase/ring-hydroxylating ferredoxin subunit